MKCVEMPLLLPKFLGCLMLFFKLWIDDWRDMALPRELQRAPRVRTLGTNIPVSGFGNEYEALGVIDAPSHPGLGSVPSNPEAPSQKSRMKHHPSEWWFDEDGLFNLDEEGRAEKQQCAVAASNVIRNFSFMPDNEVIMAQHRHCLETVFQCMEDHNTDHNTGERSLASS